MAENEPQLDQATEKRILETAEETIDRAKSKSQQPRFSQDAINHWYGSVYNFLKQVETERKPYKADSRDRDKWLREWSMKEPYWQAVLRSCNMLDSNRGWSFIGGRNQVNRFTRVLHDANQGRGWRTFSMQGGSAFRTSDLGHVTEVGRDGRNGPVAGIYFVDPVRCKLSGSIKNPLYYYPSTGKGDNPQMWAPTDFFRVVSSESTDETLNGLGWCATSAAFELILLLYGVLTHDQEGVGSRMPKGLLLLSGITQEQWNDALTARQYSLDAENRARFGGVMVLASAGDTPPAAVLTALSTLPENFDRATFMEQTWYGYAAIVGRDPSEFFPVQTGSIGRGNEPDVQHRKATQKGGAEWSLSWQEVFQRELPPTILFQFDEKDDEGELAEAEVAQAWTEVYTTIYQAGGQYAAQPISEEQYLALLSEKGIIPPEWTVEIEAATATDTEYARARYLDKVLLRADVRRAIERYQDEPIVHYHWTPFGSQTITLWESGREALRPQRWAGHKAKQRQDEEGETLYTDPDGDFTITEAEVDRALAEGARIVPPGDDELEDPGLAALYDAPGTEEEERGILARVFRRAG